jgi:hypothetical protein
MARKYTQLTATERSFLQFQELRYALKQSFGAKKNIRGSITDAQKEAILDDKLDAITTPEEKKFVGRRNIIVKAVVLLSEYLGAPNPCKIVQLGRAAMADTQKGIELGGKLEEFITWLVGKGYAQPAAITTRGNAMSLFTWNNIHVKLKHGRESSGKDKRDNKIGLTDVERLEILKKMYMRGDFEMKAYIALGLAAGHRISDNVAIDLGTMKALLAKNKAYVEYQQTDAKENVLIRMVMGKFQQDQLVNFIPLIKDGRKNVFGDAPAGALDMQPVETRIREKFETLLHQVYEGDGNIITPHALRGLCERLLTNKGWADVQVYQFTGHVSGDKYRKVPFEQLVELFKSVETEVSFKFYTPGNEKAEFIAEVVQMMTKAVENKGKTDHLYHESLKPRSPGEIDAQAELEMNIAVLVHKLRSNQE